MRRRTFLGGAALALSPLPAATDTSWLADTFRELHLDAHFGSLPAPYEGFDAENTARVFSDARFQMVSAFAVCGAGYSYYPTKIGTVHPGLKHPYTGEIARALKQRGIRMLAYVSAGPDRKNSQEHPDWMVRRDPIATPELRNGSAMMCLNSPWVDEVHIPQLREIVSLYGVDGFFLDNLIGKFINAPCYCKFCRAEFGSAIPTNDRDAKVFEHHRWMALNGNRYAEKITSALPGLGFVFTHLWVTRTPIRPPASVTQLVWEPAPPYPGVLSLDFSLEARYLSSLPGIANWSCMATRGHGWGDYSLRDEAAFQHEAATLLASGGRPYLSDDNYPSGNPDRAVYEVYGKVNRQTEAMEPFVKGSRPVKDVAVLLSADSMWSKLPLIPPRDWLGEPASPGVAGAHQALVEDHVQFSILNSEVLIESLSEYRALILPEQIVLSEKEAEAIRQFVRNGGGLVATFDTGIRDARNQVRADFALADVLGVRFVGQSDVRRAFLRKGMDVQVRGGFVKVQATTAQTLFDVIPPSPGKQAPGGAAEGPGITIHSFGKGKALYCALPLFSAYFQDGTAALRQLASWMIAQVHPPDSRTIVVDHAPLNVEMSFNSQGNRSLIHLVNYTGGKRLSGAPRAQESATVQGIEIRFQSAAKPGKITLVPEKKSVAFTWKNRWAAFQAQPLAMQSVYMIES